jgi:serine O-acetyltransferase
MSNVARIAGLTRPVRRRGYEALGAGALPDGEAVLAAVERLHAMLAVEMHPETCCGLEERQRWIGAELETLEPAFAAQIRLALDYADRLDARERGAGEREAASHATAAVLFDALPELRERLFEDAWAAYRGDPSCRDPVEAIFAFPGVFAITRHRIAHVLQREQVPLLPRLIAEHAHRLTGIDIHPGARIGREFFIDHGTGVVIGETAVIGDRVTLYQGVTLGAKSFQVDESGHLVKGQPRHPIVEDDVTIYASATVLGRIRIGRGSVIGGNVWLTHSVPPGSRVYQAEPQESGFESGAGI